jgi:hypothetical protein
MKNLAQQIQRNPELKDQLLDSYETDSKEVRDFLDSLKTVVVYVVPALLEAFSTKHQEVHSPKSLKDFMIDRTFIGTLFFDPNELLWTYVGVSANGKPLCRPENSDIVQELNDDLVVKWLF